MILGHEIDIRILESTQAPGEETLRNSQSLSLYLHLKGPGLGSDFDLICRYHLNGST